MTSPDLRLAPDETASAELAARFAADTLLAALARRPTATVALTGGRAPVLLYRRLAGPPYAAGIPWARVHFFWGDERFLRPGHPDRNDRLALEGLLGPVGVPPGNVHPVPPASDVETAARLYEDLLRAHFGARGAPDFDLALLGLGEDGHVASLFAGSPALSETRRWVAPVRGAPKPPPERVTLTIPALDGAARVMILAAGAERAAALARAFSSRDAAAPVSRLNAAGGRIVWFADKASCPSGTPRVPAPFPRGADFT